MDNNELLQAIGKMMDTKLEPIISDIKDLKKAVSNLEKKTDNIQGEVTMLHGGQNYIIEWVDKIDATVKDLSLGLPR